MLRHFFGIAAPILFILPQALAAPPGQPNPINPHTETAFQLGVPRDYAKAHGLRGVQEPTFLTGIGGVDALGFEQRMTPSAARAWTRMREAASRDGVELRAVSAFRSIEVQLAILRGKLARGRTIGQILRVSAAPGFSEHHSGRAIDITTPGYAPVEEEFERSPAFAWLMKNARRYGFFLSYPRQNAHAMAYEPWHWCWRGDDSATTPLESGTTAEIDPLDTTNLFAEARGARQ